MIRMNLLEQNDKSLIRSQALKTLAVWVALKSYAEVCPCHNRQLFTRISALDLRMRLI